MAQAIPDANVAGAATRIDNAPNAESALTRTLSVRVVGALSTAHIDITDRDATSTRALVEHLVGLEPVALLQVWACERWVVLHRGVVLPLDSPLPFDEGHGVGAQPVVVVVAPGALTLHVTVLCKAMHDGRPVTPPPTTDDAVADRPVANVLVGPQPITISADATGLDVLSAVMSKSNLSDVKL